MGGGCRERVLVVATPGAPARGGPCTDVYLLRLGGLEGLREALSRSRPSRVLVVADPSRPEAAVYAAAAVKALGHGKVEVEASYPGLGDRIVEAADRVVEKLDGSPLREETLLRLAAEASASLESRWEALAEALYTGRLAPIASMATLITVLFAVFSVSTGFPLDFVLAGLGFPRAAELVAGLAPSNLIASLFDEARIIVEALLPGALGSVAAAVVNGVGVVASLAPVVALTVLAVAALQDSGLMARLALGLRPLTAPLGLPSQALYPLLVATGCNVPAIMTAERLGDGKLLNAVALAAPLVPCSARLAVIAAFSFALFSNPLLQAVAAASVYAVSIILAATVAGAAYRIQGGREPPRLAIDLPPLRRPRLSPVLDAAIDAVKEFSAKIAGPIVAAAALIWLATSPEAPEATRLLGEAVAGVVAPIFTLIGIEGWPAQVLALAAIAGAAAKEIVLEAIAVQAGTPHPWEAVAALGLNQAQAYAALLFYTLYAPCIATAAAILGATRSPKLLAASYALSIAVAVAAMTLAYKLAEVIGVA